MPERGSIVASVWLNGITALAFLSIPRRIFMKKQCLRRRRGRKAQIFL